MGVPLPDVVILRFSFYSETNINISFGRKNIKGRCISRRKRCDHAALQKLGHYIMLAGIADQRPFACFDTTFHHLLMAMVGVQGLEPWVSRPPAWRFTN